MSTAHYVASREKPGAHHNKYKEKYRLNDIFTHRDPNTPADYEYYVRAVKRFRNILKSKEGKLFVICCREEIDIAKQLPELVTELSHHTTNFYLLAFALQKPAYLQLERISSGENYSLYSLTPESEERFTGKFSSLTDEMVIISKVLSFNLETLETVSPPASGTQSIDLPPPAGLGERNHPNDIIPRGATV